MSIIKVEQTSINLSTDHSYLTDQITGQYEGDSGSGSLFSNLRLHSLNQLILCCLFLDFADITSHVCGHFSSISSLHHDSTLFKDITNMVHHDAPCRWDKSRLGSQEVPSP